MTHSNNQYSPAADQQNLDQYWYSGWKLINKIKDHERVISIGCGNHPFKGKIKNIVGIDPVSVQADYLCTLQEFNTDEKFDVAFCLDSINSHSENNIISQIELVLNLLKPTARIYWRCIPNLINKDANTFSWSPDMHIKYTRRYKFNHNIICWDNNKRIYAEWYR